eukprot:TRINITY_DN6878_c0_g1_i1.p1 TRINITY_DN6878_c0_g1~~TRINITY_DN6878_c0_g1_i1.p1  ORF type:complete len:369 (+),score=82.42 TRINITY_DN6878_c0_g1_i1:55-1161(+)
MSQTPQAVLYEQISLLRQLKQWREAFQKVMCLTAVEDESQLSMIDDVVMSYLWEQWSPFLRFLTKVPNENGVNRGWSLGESGLMRSSRVGRGVGEDAQDQEEEEDEENEEPEDEEDEYDDEEVSTWVYSIDIYYAESSSSLQAVSETGVFGLLSSTISMQAVELLKHIRDFQAKLYSFQQADQRSRIRANSQAGVSGGPSAASTANRAEISFDFLRVKLNVWVYLLSPVVNDKMVQSSKMSLMHHILPLGRFDDKRSSWTAKDLKVQLRNLLLAAHVRLLLSRPEESIFQIERNCPTGTCRLGGKNWITGQPKISIESLKTIVQSFKSEEYSTVQPFVQHIGSLHHYASSYNESRRGTFFARFGWLHL